MSIIVPNKRGAQFNLADIEVSILDYVEKSGNIVSQLSNSFQYYIIEVRLLAQIWKVGRRYSDFDEMHRWLKQDLDPQTADSIPELPEKKFFFSKTEEFLDQRLRGLRRYIKLLILIYEAIENPILQKFFKVDINFDPNFEYAPIPFSNATRDEEDP